MDTRPAHERRRGGDRRRSIGRRRSDIAAGSWYASAWADQRLQFLTRYLFAGLGVLYFNGVFEYRSEWLSREAMNAVLAGYVLCVTALFVHARRHPLAPGRLRAAMWVDVVGVSLAVLNDPFVVPLSSLVYIVIVLGNGMRYGMRYFTEALAATFLAGLVTLSLRYAGTVADLGPEVIFLNVFAALILLYAYVLMGRVDRARLALERDSRADPLTGLLNRAALRRAAERLLGPVRDGSGRLVVMFADMDKFKRVNDTLGHAEGDRVLCQVARILRGQVREDDVVARYGGDEFVLLLEHASAGDAEAIGRRIQAAVEAWGRGEGLDVSVTIGIGEAPAHGRDLDELLANVDRALYRSKARGAGGGLCLVMP